MEKQTAQGVLFYQLESDPLHKLLKKNNMCVRNIYYVVVVKSKKKQMHKRASVNIKYNYINQHTASSSDLITSTKNYDLQNKV